MAEASRPSRPCIGTQAAGSKNQCVPLQRSIGRNSTFATKTENCSPGLLMTQTRTGAMMPLTARPFEPGPLSESWAAKNIILGREIFCRSCSSFLARFCRKKLSGFPQCAQTDGNTVKTVRQASYMMPSKPLSAQACLQVQRIMMLSSTSVFS